MATNINLIWIGILSNIHLSTSFQWDTKIGNLITRVNLMFLRLKVTSICYENEIRFATNLKPKTSYKRNTGRYCYKCQIDITTNAKSTLLRVSMDIARNVKSTLNVKFSLLRRPIYYSYECQVDIAMNINSILLRISSRCCAVNALTMKLSHIATKIK